MNTMYVHMAVNCSCLFIFMTLCLVWSVIVMTVGRASEEARAWRLGPCWSVRDTSAGQSVNTAIAVINCVVVIVATPFTGTGVRKLHDWTLRGEFTGVDIARLDIEWTLWDWTLRGEFTGVDIAGLDIERWIHRSGHCGTGHQRWGLESETRTRVATRVAILGLETWPKRLATWLEAWWLAQVPTSSSDRRQGLAWIR